MRQRIPYGDEGSVLSLRSDFCQEVGLFGTDGESFFINPGRTNGNESSLTKEVSFLYLVFWFVLFEFTFLSNWDSPRSTPHKIVKVEDLNFFIQGPTNRLISIKGLPCTRCLGPPIRLISRRPSVSSHPSHPPLVLLSAGWCRGRRRTTEGGRRRINLRSLLDWSSVCDRTGTNEIFRQLFLPFLTLYTGFSFGSRLKGSVKKVRFSVKLLLGRIVKVKEVERSSYPRHLWNQVKPYKIRRRTPHQRSREYRDSLHKKTDDSHT